MTKETNLMSAVTDLDEHTQQSEAALKPNIIKWGGKSFVIVSANWKENAAHILYEDTNGNEFEAVGLGMSAQEQREAVMADIFRREKEAQNFEEKSAFLHAHIANLQDDILAYKDRQDVLREENAELKEALEKIKNFVFGAVNERAEKAEAQRDALLAECEALRKENEGLGKLYAKAIEDQKNYHSFKRLAEEAEQIKVQRDKLLEAAKQLLEDMNKDYLPISHPQAGTSTAHEIACEKMKAAIAKCGGQS